MIPGRQVHQPEDAPRPRRLEQRGESRGRERPADGAHAAVQHHQPPARLRRHRLGHQRVDDRQHAAGGKAHQKTHQEVGGERRHRAADRRADEHQRGQQDRRASAEAIGQDAPHHRADRGAGQRADQQPRRPRRCDPVLRRHPRKHEAERGRLHDVDDQRHAKHEQQAPMRAGQRRIVDGPEVIGRRPVRRRPDTGASSPHVASTIPAATRNIPAIITRLIGMPAMWKCMSPAAR